MPSRRAHTKSRLGCVQCKARRVKCDQTYPTCKNCIRHEKTCVYSQIKISASSSSEWKTTNGEVPQHGAAIAVAMPPGGSTFDALDLKLMHQFCTSTAASLSASPIAQEVWRDVVPTYAYTHHMLMHGVLALAAKHYVHTHKSSPDAVALHSYRTRALYHHQLGLQMFRQQVVATGEDRSQILLAFAAILGILTFADADPEQQGMAFDEALNFLAVLRGKQALWESGSGMPEISDLAPIFFAAAPPETKTDLSSTAFALTQLHDAIEDNVRSNAIATLKRMAAESRVTSEFRLLGTWPAGLSDEFLHLLKSRDEIALQTFVHYCTILDSMRELWWVGSFGQKLRAAIKAVQPQDQSPDATRQIGDS